MHILKRLPIPKLKQSRIPNKASHDLKQSNQENQVTSKISKSQSPKYLTGKKCYSTNKKKKQSCIVYPDLAAPRIQFIREHSLH